MAQDNRELATAIYEHLNNKGAGLGNISIFMIERVLDDSALRKKNIRIYEFGFKGGGSGYG